MNTEFKLTPRGLAIFKEAAESAEGNMTLAARLLAEQLAIADAAARQIKEINDQRNADIERMLARRIV